MADITLYVAVVTGGFTAIGAAIPQISINRQARRAELERSEAVGRDACLALVRAAVKLRTQVANNHDHGESDMAPLLALVREYAADVEICAHTVAFLLPPLADLAMNLGVAAARQAEKAERHPRRPPDFTELSTCIAAFGRKVARVGPAGPADS